jgi:hypothetical protein
MEGSPVNPGPYRLGLLGIGFEFDKPAAAVPSPVDASRVGEPPSEDRLRALWRTRGSETSERVLDVLAASGAWCDGRGDALWVWPVFGQDCIGERYRPAADEPWLEAAEDFQLADRSFVEVLPVHFRGDGALELGRQLPGVLNRFDLQPAVDLFGLGSVFLTSRLPPVRDPLPGQKHERPDRAHRASRCASGNDPIRGTGHRCLTLSRAASSA